MTVNSADLQGALTDQQGGLSTGTMEVNLRASMIRLASPTRTYDISIPARHLSMDLQGYNMQPSSDSGCEITATSCTPAQGFDLNQNMIFVIVGIAAVAGIGVIAKKKIRR